MAIKASAQREIISASFSLVKARNLTSMGQRCLLPSHGDSHRKGYVGRGITILKYNIIHYLVYWCLILLVDDLKRVFLLACFDKAW